jgi:hypothetical protein
MMRLTLGLDDLADYLAIAEEVGGLAGVGVEVPHEVAATKLGGLSDGVVRMVSAVR